MPYLFLDLDNTLLYSHRHIQRGPSVCVEYLNGRKQSFVTQKTFAFFGQQNFLEVIPVTTRTRQQVARLEGMFQHFSWKNVLICNGAVLLIDGAEEKHWINESIEITRDHRAAFYRALDIARFQVPKESIVCVEPFMFYIKSTDTDNLQRYLEGETDQSLLTICRDARKVYCFPNVLNKGAAVKRYMKRFGSDFCIAAGDSIFDLPMLNTVDVALYPEILNSLVQCKNGKMCKGIFSDAICEELNNIMRMRLLR